MFLLLSTFIATFSALFSGLMVLLGVLLGGGVFLLFVLALLVAGVNALIESWSDRRAHARA